MNYWSRGLGLSSNRVFFVFFSQTLYTHSAPFPSGPGLKLGEENPGLVLNMISDLKALKTIQVNYFCLQFDDKMFWKEIEKIIWRRLLNKGIKKPGLKFKYKWYQQSVRETLQDAKGFS